MLHGCFKHIDKYGDCNLQIHALYYAKCWWIECCVFEEIHVLHGLFVVNAPLCTLIIYKAAETLYTHDGMDYVHRKE